MPFTLSSIPVLCINPPLTPAGKDYLNSLTSQGLCSLTFLPQSDRLAFKDELARIVGSTPGGFKACIFFLRYDIPTPFPLDEEVLEPLVEQAGCRMITAGGAGYDRIDVEYLTRAGCVFANNPVEMGIRTADTTASMILGLLRGTTHNDAYMRAGRWRDPEVVIKDARTSTLGIIGMGRIGKQLAVHMQHFGMSILYTNRSGPLPPSSPENDPAWEHVTFDDLLAQSDVISLNCPLTEETRGLLGKKEFGKMKKDVLIVNTSRGPVINESDLVDALESGQVLRAALDVFENEPKVHPRLLELDTVTLSPHNAVLNETVRKAQEREQIGNLEAFLRKGVPNTPVNRLAI